MYKLQNILLIDEKLRANISRIIGDGTTKTSEGDQQSLQGEGAINVVID